MTTQAPVPTKLNYGVCAHAIVAVRSGLPLRCYPTESLLPEWMDL